jgi:hypothetical protein
MMLWFGKYTLPGMLLAFLLGRYIVFQFSPFSVPHPPLRNLSRPVSLLPISLRVFSAPPPPQYCVVLSAARRHGKGLHFPLSCPSPLPVSINQGVLLLAEFCLLTLFAPCALFFPFCFLLDCFLLPQREGLPPAKSLSLCPPSPPNLSFLPKVTQVFKDTRCCFVHAPQSKQKRWIFSCLPYVKQNILLSSSPCFVSLSSSFTGHDSKSHYVFLLYLGRGWNMFCPPLWSSGQSSWLQIRRPGFDSRHYQILWEVVGLERCPLSLVGTTEGLLDRKVAAPIQK